MKKILLVLSCCLATWCSVQAGPKSSPEISMMQASAPAAAPAPAYPAVINSASLKNGVVTVSFTVGTVKSGSYVSFNLEATGKSPAQDVYTKREVTSGNSYTVSFSIPKDWQVANAVVIKVNGSPCGGASLTPVPPVENKVTVGEISHDAVNKIVTVKFSISKPTSGTTIIVHNNDKNSDVYKKEGISSSLRSYQLPSSIFVKNTDYSIKVINSGAYDSQNFKITDRPAGHIAKVEFCGDQNDPNVNYAAFKYNLHDAYNPYLYIQEGIGENGPVVEKIKIRNTNGVYVNAILHDYPYILRENTTYTAFLYDVKQNGNEMILGIGKEFKIPTTFVKQKEYPEWHFDEGANELVIRAPQSWPKYLKNISIMVYSNNGGALTPQGNATATNLGDWVRIRITDATINRYYTIVVTAGGSYHCDITMPIRK